MEINPVVRSQSANENCKAKNELKNTLSLGV